jgi:hypothetical protein
MLSIGIRYCGGCNPQIDRSGVIRVLKEDLEKQGIRASFSTDKLGSYDILLLMNGCMHACLEEAYLKEGHTSPYISIKGEMVDDSFIAEERIPESLVKKISGLSQSLQR